MIRTAPRPALIAAVLITALAGCLPGQGRQAPALGVTPGEPLLQITLPAQGARATLKRVGVNGDVETWQSGDGVSVSLRRGVVVATRGLGFDLMGADAGPTLAALSGGPAGPYRHQMRYLTGDNHSTYLSAGCTMAQAGGRHEETCITHRGRFTNLYWLDSAGRILKSRQWIATEIGYLEIESAGGASAGAKSSESVEIVLEP